MSKPTLNQIRSLGNFSTSENWYFQITNLPKAGGISFSSDDINWRCESVDVPKRETPTLQVQIRGQPPVNQHGTATPSGSTTLTLFSTDDMRIEKAIQELLKLSHDLETGFGHKKADYEMSARLVRMDVTGKEVLEYNFIGVLMESYDPGANLGATADQIKQFKTL